MEERNNSDEITFQLYVDAVIEQKIPWHTFTKWTKDFYNSDMDRLKHLNAMILMKLTVSYSDMERSTYLNAILLRELKKSILKVNMSEEENENESFQDAKNAAPMNNESEEQFEANNYFKKDQCISHTSPSKSHVSSRLQTKENKFIKEYTNTGNVDALQSMVSMPLCNRFNCFIGCDVYNIVIYLFNTTFAKTCDSTSCIKWI